MVRDLAHAQRYAACNMIEGNIPPFEARLMSRRMRFHILLATTLIVGGVASCTTDTISAPQPGAQASLLGSGNAPSLITCPAADSRSTTGLIGPLGGVLSVGNTSVVIPANAVLDPTTFTLKVPSSKYVEIEVTANGGEHYVFAQPVTVTIDYGRCSRSNIDLAPLSAWNIDPVTKALLEREPSVDNKLTRTVTFTTIHFSGYAVAD
jgi:hypothetical protein